VQHICTTRGAVAETQHLRFSPSTGLVQAFTPSCGQDWATWFQLSCTVPGSCIHSLPLPSLKPACAVPNVPASRDTPTAVLKIECVIWISSVKGEPRPCAELSYLGNNSQ